MRLVFPLLSSPSGLTLSFLLDVYSSLSIGFSILALASLKYFPTHLLSVQIRPGHFFAWNPAMSSHSFKIKARLVKLCRLWLLLCFSALSHVPLSPAEMWTARETPPSFQFLKPWKLFSTLRPCLNTCLRALHTARLFLAFRSHLSGPLLRWVFLDYHKVHLTPHVTTLLKHPHFFIALPPPTELHIHSLWLSVSAPYSAKPMKIGIFHLYPKHLRQWQVHNRWAINIHWMNDHILTQ